MPYIPLNRIITNQYTSGQEYYKLASGAEYVGYYHKLYNGKAYSGKSPQDGQPEELGLYSANEAAASADKTVYYKLSDYLGGAPSNGQVYDINPDLVQNYLTLKGIFPNNPPVYKLPTSYIPQPTSQDYTIGEIERYFVKRNNALEYTEVNQTTFQDIRSQNTAYFWQYYTAFSLPWQISGDEMEVAKVNRNMVLLTEQRNKIRGLQEFLRFDYLKFYKS